MRKPVRVLLTTIFEYPHTGGLSTHMQTLKSGLEALGHHVDTLSFSDVPYLKRKGLIQGPSFLMNKTKRGKGFVWSQKMRMSLLTPLLKRVEGKYDVAGVQDVFAALASKEAGLLTALTVHGYMAREAISKGSVLPNSTEEAELLQAEKEAYMNADQVVTVDQRIKNYIKDLTGVQATAIRNFIDVEAFQPNKTKKKIYKEELGFKDSSNILFIPRRLTEKNGVIYPAMAMQSILEKFPETLLLYAGDGEERSKIKKIAEEKHIENQVLLLGAVPHDKMQKYYSIADIVLIPSVFSEGVEEATSIAALEAMGSGTPVIASGVGGLKEIIEDGKDGILVEEKSISALSNKVNLLLGDSELGQNLAVAAREKIEKDYSHITAAKKYAEIYERIWSH